MTSTKKLVGYIIALVGGGLGLLAFFAMPFFAAGYLNFTGQQLASLSMQAFQQNDAFTSNSGSALVLLWLAPVLAGLIALVAVFQFRSSALVVGKKAVDAWLITLGILGVALYAGLIIYVYTQLSIGSTNAFSISYLGSGYWAYLIAMLGAIVGGTMARGAKSTNGPRASRSSSYTQYAPPPPQYPVNQQPSSSPYPPYEESPYTPPPPPNK